MPAFDVAFVGGGFRTTSFLAANSALLEKPLCIVEAANRLGPGSFEKFTLTSSSDGSGFFRHIDRSGDFGWVFRDPIIGAVANSSVPVSLESLSAALAGLGTAIHRRLGNSVLLGNTVEYIDVDPAAEYPVTLGLHNTEAIRAKVCVLGTGRFERMHDSLRAMAYKILMSSALLSRHNAHQIRARIRKSARIVILGCSHSAFSALAHMLDMISELRSCDPAFAAPDITIVHRRSVRLSYATIAEARQTQVQGREEIADAARDVCPDTGIVFRDSGLRHGLRDLYCSIWRGDVPFVRMHRVRELRQCDSFLRGADVIVQALGYTPRVPEIRLDGEVVRPENAPSHLGAGDDGRIPLPIRSDRLHIAGIRLEPTPRSAADHSAHAKNLYGSLAGRIIEELQHRSARPDVPVPGFSGDHVFTNG